MFWSSVDVYFPLDLWFPSPINHTNLIDQERFPYQPSRISSALPTCPQPVYRESIVSLSVHSTSCEISSLQVHQLLKSCQYGLNVNLPFDGWFEENIERGIDELILLCIGEYSLDC